MLSLGKAEKKCAPGVNTRTPPLRCLGLKDRRRLERSRSPFTLFFQYTDHVPGVASSIK